MFNPIFPELFGAAVSLGVNINHANFMVITSEREVLLCSNLARY